MKLFLLTLIFGLTTAVCIAQIEDDEDLSYVARECNSKLKHIDSIEKFDWFMKRYKNVISKTEKPKRGLLNLDAKLRKCYDLAEALIELDKIVSSRTDGICSMDYVKRLAGYHFKFLTKSKSNENENETNDMSNPDMSNRSLNSSYISYFFSLFAHEVAHVCKSKLHERVSDAQHEQDCSAILMKFLPQTFIPDDPENPELSEASQFLRNFRRVENFAPILKVSNAPDVYYDVIVSDEAVEKVEQLKDQCRSREPYYTALFAPIAILAQLGYSVEDSSIDSDDLGSPETRLLKCWLATAQLCQGILRAHLNVKHDVEIDPALQSKFVSIKWGAAPIDAVDRPFENMKFSGDSVQEISPQVLGVVKKKFTNIGKIKRKAMSWAKGFIERHINTDALQREASKKFMEAMTDVDSGHDSKVAFSGKKYDERKFNPVSIVTDDADTIVKMSSSFWNKEVGLLVSSIVAVVMSAVFVWFSLYALATTLKQHMSNKDDGNFKAEWKALRDQRVQKMESKLNKKGTRDMFTVYKPV